MTGPISIKTYSPLIRVELYQGKINALLSPKLKEKLHTLLTIKPKPALDIEINYPISRNSDTVSITFPKHEVGRGHYEGMTRDQAYAVCNAMKALSRNEITDAAIDMRTGQGQGLSLTIQMKADKFEEIIIPALDAQVEFRTLRDKAQASINNISRKFTTLDGILESIPELQPGIALTRRHAKPRDSLELVQEIFYHPIRDSQEAIADIRLHRNRDIELVPEDEIDTLNAAALAGIDPSIKAIRSKLALMLGVDRESIGIAQGGDSGYMSGFYIKGKNNIAAFIKTLNKLAAQVVLPPNDVDSLDNVRQISGLQQSELFLERV